MKEKKEKKSNLAKIITPKFRVAFPHVFKPSAMPGADKEKYSVVMLYKKSQDLTPIKRALRAAKIAKFGADKDEWPDLESPVVDGDDSQFEDYEGYKGHWAIKASTNPDQKPSVVDENVDPIVDQGDFYPGCYAIASVFAFVWKFGKKEGVSFILDHIQKVGDGKPFGGKKPADQVFSPVSAGDDDEDDSDVDDDF